MTDARYPTAPKTATIGVTATPPTLSHNAPTASVAGWAGLARSRVTELPCGLTLGTCVCVTTTVHMVYTVSTRAVNAASVLMTSVIALT